MRSSTHDETLLNESTQHFSHWCSESHPGKKSMDPLWSGLWQKRSLTGRPRVSNGKNVIYLQHMFKDKEIQDAIAELAETSLFCEMMNHKQHVEFWDRGSCCFSLGASLSVTPRKRCLLGFFLLNLRLRTVEKLKRNPRYFCTAEPLSGGKLQHPDTSWGAAELLGLEQ